MIMSLPARSFTIIVEEPIKKVKNLTKRVQVELDKFFPPEYKLIRQNPVTVGGNDGWKIEFRHTAPDLNYDRHIFEILTKANGKFYNLQYIEDPLKFQKRYPQPTKWLNLFKSKNKGLWNRHIYLRMWIKYYSDVVFTISLQF